MSNEQWEQETAKGVVGDGGSLVAGLVGPNHEAVFEQLSRKMSEIGAAVETFVEAGSFDEAARLTQILRDIWWRRGTFAEGRLALEAILNAPALPAYCPERATFLDQAGPLAFAAGDYEPPESLFR